MDANRVSVWRRCPLNRRIRRRTVRSWRFSDAAVKREPVPGQISALFQHIRPAVRAARGDVAAAVRENVRLQAQTLVEASPVIAALVKDGKVIVAGGIFDLESGRVDPVGLE